MKLLRRVNEPEVISEFLKNEFYQDEFHDDRAQFERLVLDSDITNAQENALRRALLFRRRGHMWRELPADTQWWQVKFDSDDLNLIRVFPRAQWRRVSTGSFQLTDIVDRIRNNHLDNKTRDFIVKVQALSYRLRRERDNSSVLLIGIDEYKPLTILEGNHRLVAAMMAGPEHLQDNFQVLCGFSPNMGSSCWYETNFANLFRYAQNRFRNFLYDRDADIKRALGEVPATAPADRGLDAPMSAGKAFPNSK
jgi:hypothetical protein